MKVNKQRLKSQTFYVKPFFMIVYSECNGLTFINSAKLQHSIPNALDLRQVLNVKVTAINRNGTASC